MKKQSYRSTSPFDNWSPGGSAISPTTDKGVIPFNNVTTIQDILDGNKSISDTYPHAGGDWSPGEDTEKNYIENADDYKRQVRDIEIINKMLSGTPSREKWTVRVPGGYKSFTSLDSAIKHVREHNLTFDNIKKVAQKTNNREAIIADSLLKCFMVESINMVEGVKETGSAFCIGKNLFITCSHVIKSYNKMKDLNEKIDSSKIILNLVQNGVRYKAKLIKYDLKLDLALIEANVNSLYFDFGYDYKVGDKIITIGSPHGYENNVSDGIIGSLNRKPLKYDGAPEYIFIDSAIFPGSSGGPIIKEETGEVVGMITMVISGTETNYGLNAGLPSSYIENFI